MTGPQAPTPANAWAGETRRDATRPGWLFVLGALAVWLILVGAGVANHEIWKDEGRALLLALSADSIFSVPSAVQGEGHPALWYLLLRAAHDVWPSSAVMPALSMAIAAIAVFLFLARAPVPFWWKLLFIFTGPCLYEYSVMTRNYGIAMLLMFLVCLVLPNRKSAPLLLGALLFLLAQTNVNAALLVPFLCGIFVRYRWTGTGRFAPRLDPAIVLCVGLAVLGLVAAVLTVHPPRHTRVIETVADSYFHQSYVKTIAVVLLQPGHFFRLITGLPSFASTALIFVMILGLIRWPILFLAALGSLWVTAGFSALVYFGGYRHQGIWFVFLVCLYWIGLARERGEAPASAVTRLPFGVAFYLAMPIVLIINCVIGIDKLTTDLRAEMSKSRALGVALNGSQDLAGAIVVAEPDELNESLQYYIANPSYLLREHKFGKIATWSSAEQRDLTLGQVLATMKELRQQTGKPVIAALEYPVRTTHGGAHFSGLWGRGFGYTEQEAAEFLRATRKLPLGATPALAENFDAYVLIDPP